MPDLRVHTEEAAVGDVELDLLQLLGAAVVGNAVAKLLLLAVETGLREGLTAVFRRRRSPWQTRRR